MRDSYLKEGELSFEEWQANLKPEERIVVPSMPKKDDNRDHDVDD